MTLVEWLDNKPRGFKTAMAKELGITLTWLGLLQASKKRPSAALARKIHAYTRGRVKARDLRPDLFD